MGGRYYWSIGDQFMGPTMEYYNYGNEDTNRDIINHIKELMMVDDLPKSLELYEEAYRFNTDTEEIVKKQEKVREHNKSIIQAILNDLPYELEVNNGYLDFGNNRIMRVEIAHNSIKLPGNTTSNDKLYILGDPKQKEQFYKEIAKRCKDRKNRDIKNKRNDTTKIGQYRHNLDLTIESADFEVNLGPGNIIEANVHVVGNIKFFKKQTRRVMFDIDKRKIMTIDGSKEIKAENSNQVIDSLIRCLADQKE